MKKHLSNQTRKRMLSILGMLLLSVPFVLAQVLVKGTVKDNLGEGVPGASVQVKSTSQGTITDLDGKFTLNIPQKNATLVISFIGYVTVEQKADSQKPMVITLKEDTKTLDEVVVSAIRKYAAATLQVPWRKPTWRMYLPLPSLHSTRHSADVSPE